MFKEFLMDVLGAALVALAVCVIVYVSSLIDFVLC